MNSNEMSPEPGTLCNQLMAACDTNSVCTEPFYEVVENISPVTVDAACWTVQDTKSIRSQTYKRSQGNKRAKAKVTKVLPPIRCEKGIGQSTHVCDIHAVISVNVVTSKPVDDESSKSVLVVENKDAVMSGKRYRKCVCSKQEFVKTGECDEACTYSCKYGGFGPCSAFTLGTADYRNMQKERCNSMLIGGCRVPVYKSFRNQFF